MPLSEIFLILYIVIASTQFCRSALTENATIFETIATPNSTHAIRTNATFSEATNATIPTWKTTLNILNITKDLTTVGLASSELSTTHLTTTKSKFNDYKINDYGFNYYGFNNYKINNYKFASRFNNYNCSC